MRKKPVADNFIQFRIVQPLKKSLKLMPSRTAFTVLYIVYWSCSPPEIASRNLVAVFGAQFWEIGTKFNREFSLENSQRAEYSAIYNKLRNNRPRPAHKRRQGIRSGV